MSLISLSFLAFMTVAFLGYFILPMKLRPYFLLLASLFFYSCFGWKAFFYLGFTTLSSFFLSLWMPKAKPSVKKLLLILSLVLNLGLLILVKYLNFTLDLVFGQE